MPVYAVLWEKGAKHDLKSLGRKAAEHIRENLWGQNLWGQVRVSGTSGVMEPLGSG